MQRRMKEARKEEHLSMGKRLGGQGTGTWDVPNLSLCPPSPPNKLSAMPEEDDLAVNNKSTTQAAHAVVAVAAFSDTPGICDLHERSPDADTLF